MNEQKTVQNIILKIAIAFSGFTIPYGESMVLAQIIPDETLGDEGSIVTPDNIKGIESDHYLMPQTPLFSRTSERRDIL